ncbi:MAG: sigma-70 family RNA polymerase sigma factor [Planctomycetes bacterium]|nr:sigma-70 family RNA polymerase sigma factor [Planctomycetota bacterium]
MQQSDEITKALANAVSGDPAATSALVNLLYTELRNVAGGILAEGHAAPTLQPTVLVHEAYLRLVEHSKLKIEDRDHFLRIAARAMRFVVLDHVRARKRDKRGGTRERVPFDSVIDSYNSSEVDLVALDEAINKLQESDEQLARIVELRFFAGFTIEETARILRVSTPTVERGWRFARAYLYKQLSGG